VLSGGEGYIAFQFQPSRALNAVAFEKSRVHVVYCISSRSFPDVKVEIDGSKERAMSSDEIVVLYSIGICDCFAR